MSNFEENQLNDNPILIRPNPVIDNINLTFKEPVVSDQIYVTDILGKTVLMKSVFNTCKECLDLSNLKEGIYIMKVRVNSEITILKGY